MIGIIPQPVLEKMMKLMDYFADTQGVGVISTADASGVPNSAVYAKPHVFGKDSVGFIMRDRLTHANISANPYASYMFVENGQRTSGIRLVLKKSEETSDNQRIEQLSRRTRLDDDQEKRYLVTFTVTKLLPLIGGSEIALG